MQVGPMSIPDTARATSHTASEMLGPNHALSTPEFEANVVLTASRVQEDDELEKTVALIQESVPPEIPVVLDSVVSEGQTWRRIGGILRESPSGVVAQLVLVTERENTLCSLTFSADAAKQAGLPGLAENYLATLRWAK